MNCVIVYNGVSGSGKSRIVDCIKTVYEGMPANSKISEYIGINDINVSSQGENAKTRPISVGIIRDISVMEEYSRMLVKLIEGPQEWIDKADYTLLSKYLRSSEKRNLLVKLKAAVESTMFGCTNNYVLQCIERIIDVDVKGKIFKGQTVLGKPLYFSNSVVPAGRPNKYNWVSCINLFFVSIREPDQIKDFVENCPYPVRTLFISRPHAATEVEDGYTEDVISNFKYDYFIANPEGVDKIIDAIKPVMHDILKDFAENAILTDSDIERLATESELDESAFDFNPFTDNFMKHLTEVDPSDTNYEWKPANANIESNRFAQTITFHDENGNEITPV